MPDSIPVSIIGTVPVIVFQNTATGNEGCWVCDSLDGVSQSLAKLATLPYITNVRVHHACAKRSD